MQGEVKERQVSGSSRSRREMGREKGDGEKDVQGGKSGRNETDEGMVAARRK